MIHTFEFGFTDLLLSLLSLTIQYGFDQTFLTKNN